jgi:L-rhamnonate dehydratase
MENPRIVRIEWAPLEAQRPRKAGSNARLDEHGITIKMPIARFWTEDASNGFGSASLTREQARTLLGLRLSDLFTAQGAVLPVCKPYQYPLWDLAGQRAGKPVYALAAAITGVPAPGEQRVPCYDTSLYFDDLHAKNDEEAAALLAAEARAGYECGHRGVKMKVGRGARHMGLEEGTRRDIAVIRAVRAAVGPDIPLMIDANDGYNLSLTKRVLAETADCRLHFMEEAFHEDAVLYRDLKAWMEKEGIRTLIADGEGAASPYLLDWAREHVIDYVQLDIHGTGFTRWLEVGPQLDAWDAWSAPHHYGSLYGNYASCHLMAPIHKFTFVEWDEATAPALDASGYALHEGKVTVPTTPGMGLRLDEPLFRRAVMESGYEVTL